MRIKAAMFLWASFALLLTSISPTNADINFRYWKNARDLEPIVIKGGYFIDFLRKPIQELYLFAYDSTTQSWRAVPFQFDQKDDSTHYWLPVPNDTLDENDELVFMAKDMGDKAPDGSYWIDAPDSRNYNRVEITATDSVSNKMGWVYLYRSKTSLPLSADMYISYKPDAKYKKGADTLIANNYIESHDSSGIPIEWKLLQGSGVNILDRQKVLIKMKLYGWLDFLVREDILAPFFKKVEKKVGPVRVVREVFWYINIMGFPPFEFSLPLLYYPYSVESGGVSGTLKASDHVNLIRQSFDLNPNAAGMKFYNPFNPSGVTIDGIGGSEGLVTTVLDAPAVNWWLITGNQGSYAIIFRMPEIGKTRTLYYNDDKTVLKEGEDTGDMMSWGNTGIQIEGTDMAGKISFAYKAFYFGPNQPYALGDTLGNNFSRPMLISTQPNYYVPVELISFHATTEKGHILLEWETATESNNFGFEIQRRTAASLDWQTIGFIQGKGTTTAPQHYRFVDDQIAAGSFYYRLKQIDFDGRFEFSSEIYVDLALPDRFVLEQNYPNPFNPETVIRYQIPLRSDGSVMVELKIYNLLGDEVRSLVQKEQRAGYYSVRWDGRDNRGIHVAAGTYVYRLQAGEFIKSHKMILLR
jgi:hypothetical protein